MQAFSFFRPAYAGLARAKTRAVLSRELTYNGSTHPYFGLLHFAALSLARFLFFAKKMTIDLTQSENDAALSSTTGNRRSALCRRSPLLGGI